MSPFPEAAQYYPEMSEFDEDKGIDLEVYQCSSCGLVQLIAEPVSYYREVITAASLSPKAREARLAEIRDIVEHFGLSGKKAIEIGSAKGGMVDVLASAGLDAVGLEYGMDSVIDAQQAGYNVIQGYISDLHVEDSEKFDVFVSLNYLEHQPDTKNFIQSLFRITTNNAVGYVTVPNLEYLLSTNCLYEFVADHLVYFTRNTLRLAFEMNGFDVVDCQLINNDNDIAIILRKRPVLEISGIDEVEGLLKELSAFAKQCQSKGKKLAVWGAGHRTLALLSLAKVNTLEFIVDSADFKQGKYSPVMHTKIVSPAMLKASDVDKVIVMVPGIYPDEVIKIIREFNREFEIYQLQNNMILPVDN
jgi:2-polyprenyl-3-methyl-5-hydroxy-6-metoxy-1,4-benzoquinol methylase